MSKKIHTKQGAASFYIVAFSSLLFVVIAASFAAVIISEVSRTSGNDMSQSAYDSALAGIEDAKTAIMNYESCVNQGAVATTTPNKPAQNCGDIMYYMEHKDCDMVANILGRSVTENGVEIDEGIGNNMLQTYTCVEIETELDDFRSTINASNPARVISLDNIDAASVSSIRISWYSDTDGTTYNYSNFNGSRVVFPSLTSKAAAVPPTISVQLLQTTGSFTLSDLEISQGDRTDRGTIYLVPADGAVGAGENYINATATNTIDADAFVSSNNKQATNYPYVVDCNKDTDSEFACSVAIDLPEPIGGTRDSGTFFLVIALPYATPDTDFSLELCTTSASGCDQVSYTTHSQETDVVSNPKIQIKNTQISIDSTGRANDYYRRIETRIETSNPYFPYLPYAIQLFGNGTNTLNKTIQTSEEYGI